MVAVGLIIGLITYFIFAKYDALYDYQRNLDFYAMSNKKAKEERLKRDCYEKKRDVFYTMSGVAFAISILVFVVAIIMLGFGAYAKMSMPIYEEENAKIEEQVSEFVSKYTDYEKDAFKELKPETMQIMIMTYPELKTNELVKKQIDVYVSNNDKLKKLKEDCNQYKVGKWLLYFG